MKRAEIVADLFGVDARDVRLDRDRCVIGDRTYRVVDDVIVLLDDATVAGEAKSVQHSFGREWEAYRSILPEHRDEFRRYFDLVDVDALADKRAIDLGCGSGRWSVLLADKVKELVLVDFSDAIFVARENLRPHDDKCVFFRADVTALPFRDDCADFAFSLGVLHHLPIPCLDAVRSLARIAPELLVFLYYALDNRPAHWRALLAGVTVARRALSRLQNEPARRLIASAGARALYEPLIKAGDVVDALGFGGSRVPLWDGYHGMSTERIEQDVYDRFFTSIEQRVSRAEIRTLTDTFDDVVISDGLPYWHFVCRRAAKARASSGAAGR